ncbi:MAG: hypothetical protein LBI12_01270 [Treponema sp.]|nr:hypothetical protein [Treponema sp.]
MGINIFTKKEAALKTIFKKTAKFFSLDILSEYVFEHGDISYIDILNLSGPELKKILSVVKNNCNDTPWGIIDTKGSIKDSASLFFAGASDYLGPSFLKNMAGFDGKRIKEAGMWRKAMVIKAGVPGDSFRGETKEAGFIKSGIKLPAENSFPGWKKMQSGKVMPFYLLYCSLHGKIPFESRFDAKTIAQIHKQFLACLESYFLEADGLLWMNTGHDCLFLIPPQKKCIEAAIKICINMIVSSPLIVMETINLKLPANFTFALHYDSLNYYPPGRTGTIVSDAVNFIFHLGAKKAEPGRLSVSGEIPEKTIPQTLLDCFVSAAEFEGRRIWHTKKFSYAKPWV